MKSFHLDPDSIEEVLRGWPVFLIAIVLTAVLAWLSSRYEWVRVLVPIACGIALGPQTIGQLRARYPGARCLWLLSIGMMTCLFGVAARMAFPAWQGFSFDISWLSVTFFSILSFVIINRGNKDVVQ